MQRVQDRIADTGQDARREEQLRRVIGTAIGRLERAHYHSSSVSLRFTHIYCLLIGMTKARWQYLLPLIPDKQLQCTAYAGGRSICLLMIRE